MLAVEHGLLHPGNLAYRRIILASRLTFMHADDENGRTHIAYEMQATLLGSLTAGTCESAQHHQSRLTAVE